uniref:Uncharacterized protein n=1 Tax=Neobodo designis TaxID=312471 RepID=A0A7S1PS48_NEODS|mmetsp:Transcript_17808/g.55282  ORF Transcript_17808/g.55282 Transcript_17808/m.55282 type:complete len:144 (+) Transcript_17808:2-433(+)
MLHLNVFPVVLDLVKNAPHSIRREAVWCVSNAACDATDVDVQGMLAAGVIPALGAVLAYNDAKVLSVALEAVDNLLGKAPEDAKAAIEAHGMMDQLERLQDHQSSDVSNRAQQMLEEHYYVEEDGEPGAERFDAAELGTFKFE